MYSLYSFVVVLFVASFAVSDTEPLVIPWNTTHSYGPDGPWSVITVQVGSSDIASTKPLSTVDLYPGGLWESMILTAAFCNNNGLDASDDSSQCYAEKAGLYDLEHSQTVHQNITDAPGLVWQAGSSEAQEVGGLAKNVLDTMFIQAQHGTFAVYNSTISAVQAWRIGLPDGTHYSAQVGTLSLGAPGMGIQTFGASGNGQTVPGYAYAQGVVASNSWGLHYGSASLKQEGSLVFGGYDQSRVLGDVGAFGSVGGYLLNPNLLDIQIGVENGPSPFNESSYIGLLRLNESFNGVQPALINPIVPYLFMSPETCAAIAKDLPVTLNTRLGLYIWNTGDPQYEKILKSSAYLAFVFQKAGSGNLTIKVSFQLLNLTLEAPLVIGTQQYFPCRPFHALDNSGNYYLGKAFLQAAFIGMNWQENQIWFLAQAPGPGVRGSNIRPIGPNDTAISADSIENFAETWADNWKAPTAIENNRNITATPTTNGKKGTANAGVSKSLTEVPTGATNGQKDASESETPSKAKIGIAVGVVVGALAVAGAVLLSYIRGRRTAVPPQEKVVAKQHGICVYEKDGVAQVPEIGEGLRHEADNDHEIYELDIGGAISGQIYTK